MKLFFCYKNSVTPIENEPQISELHLEIESLLNVLEKYIENFLNRHQLHITHTDYLSIKLIKGKLDQLIKDCNHNDMKIYNGYKNDILVRFYKKIKRSKLNGVLKIDESLMKDPQFLLFLETPLSIYVVKP